MPTLSPKTAASTPRLVTPACGTFRVSPFWKGSSSFSVAWKLYRATDSMAVAGRLEGSRGCLGLAPRRAVGSGLSTRCGGAGGQETALMSALPRHHEGPVAATAAQMCGGGEGSRASPPGCQGTHVPKDGSRIWHFLGGEWWAVAGVWMGNRMVMGWARVEDVGKGGWRAQAVLMGESLVLWKG